jgi:hypothetical protein
MTGGKMKKSRILIAAILGISIFTGISFSIPGFSKKEGMDCSGCHSGYPRLNNDGRKYQGNGYSFEREPLEEAPGFALSGAVESWFVSKKEGRSTDFQLHKFEVFAGGRLSKNAGYFAEAYFEERGAFHNLGDIFVEIDLRRDLRLRAGQFQPDLLLSDSERLTTRRTLLYNTRVNGWRLRDRQRGLAVSGAWNRFSAVAAVVNGNGSGAESDHEADDNDYKDVSLAVVNNVTDEMAVGGYGYYGKVSNADGSGDYISRLVFSLRQRLMEERFELNAVGGYGRNSNPGGLGNEQESFGFFLEGVYAYRPNLLLLARYDYFDRDTGIDQDHNWAVVPAVFYYLGQNIRVSGEYVFFKDGRMVKLVL